MNNTVLILNGSMMQQEKGLITPAEFRDGVRKMIGKAVSDKQIDAAWNSFLVCLLYTSRCV